MRHRRKGEPPVKPVIVTLPDGTLFRCAIASVGREAQPRWMIIDQSGAQYVGPEATADKSPEAVQKLVTEWWANRATTH